MNDLLLPIILTILNYLAGSISSAIIIGKYTGKDDIRKKGFKTAGGSNVAEVSGVKWGILVAVFDILKGIPILLVAKYLGIDEMWQVLIAIAAVCGHCWPIWFNFSGGRGLATTFGGLVILTPKLAIYPVVIFLLTLIPYLLRKRGIYLKFISSPTMTLFAIIVYIWVTLESPESYDEVFSLLIMIIVLFRRVTARIDEYKQYNPLKLFFSRLIFDNSETIK